MSNSRDVGENNTKMGKFFEFVYLLRLS